MDIEIPPIVVDVEGTEETEGTEGVEDAEGTDKAKEVALQKIHKILEFANVK